jgi:hypothetical protein
MKLAFITTIIFVFSILSVAQNRKDFDYADSIAGLIPEPLTYSTREIADWVSERLETDEERARAYFTWLASNISYDLLDTRESLAENELDEFISGTLIWRKGKCQAYAEVFHDLCIKSGIQSYVVPGIVIPLPGKPVATHAWIAVFLDNRWMLSDPTFGAGYVIDNRFYSEFDDKFWDIDPEEIIKTHFPYDPIWQMLERPYTLRHYFRDPDATFPTEEPFMFADSISVYLNQENLEQLFSERRRVLQYGADHPLFVKYLERLEENIRYEENLIAYNILNICIEAYNEAVNTYNETCHSSNLSRIPKNKREACIETLDELSKNLDYTRKTLSEIETQDEEMWEKIVELNQSIRGIQQGISDKAAIIERSMR